MTTNNTLLNQYRQNVFDNVAATCEKVRKAREEKGYVSVAGFLVALKTFLTPLIQEKASDFPIDLFDIDMIERSSFHADIVFKSTALMSSDKNAYFKQYCPELITILQSLSFQDAPFFEEVKMVGIYVNAKIPAHYLFTALEQVISLGNEYGKSDSGKGGDIVIDYSSPNAAKHLHAGHIRSTIIGHVLGNMHEACGYTVHRVNYLNDWGGMGVLMHGLSLRNDIDAYENKNNLLFEIYSTFRKAQKASDKEDEYSKLTDEDKTAIMQLTGAFSSFEELKNAFAIFSKKSNEQFALLEQGDANAYEIWRKIVEWSILDFNQFYNILDIHQDYLTGEGLYAQYGKDFVMSEVEKGNMVYFDEILAKEEIKKIEEKRANEEITTEQAERKLQEIAADIGCYTVMLDNGERFVVLKKDGSTIYATRDIAAIAHRMSVFDPKKIIYEVGQEQQDHFEKLFHSAKQIGIAKGTELTHIYHGFYVDEDTKKKLSSRDGASNIIKLLNDTIAYFYAKYDDSEEFGEEEKQHMARVLGVGSIIFNDIKKDKKSSVAISSDSGRMMKQFEEAGGAYLIYASCRAKNIERKYEKPLPNIADIAIGELTDTEADLIKKLLSFPEVVKRAANGNDPVKIAEYITSLASLFNSYYHSTPILKGDKVEQGIIISHCVSQVIDNGLKILHINSLQRI